ncbi:MAG TPA: HWE histidine kinase domain-containing protein, partial [Reyranella sp.]|nr:HWE histidine kinase domain-containing protein [Reyranella sp.]
NVGAERLIGYAEAEIIGLDGDVIFTPDDRAAGAPERERAGARAHGRAEDERWHVRKDGSRFWGSGFLMPLNDGSGFVKIMRDLTGRQLAEARLKAREELFRVLATNIPQLVFRTRDDGMRTWGSPQWIVFTGVSFEDSLDFGWLQAIHPEDRDVTTAGWPEARRRGEYYVEHRIRRSEDGEYRWHQTRAVPVTPKDNEAEWVGTSTDVHDLRGLQERQKVLLAELQHRTRNLLAVVQSLGRQTARTSGSIEEFTAEFDGRLRALGRVQSLLARVDHGPVELGALIDAELQAHEDAGWERGKVMVDGPPVLLPANSAQAMALAIHELTTNAVKYGALKQHSGRLSVVWRVEGNGDAEPRAILDWWESGVPTFDVGPQPPRRGYGRELIERALPHQLDAETRFEFGPDGVRCRIAVQVRHAEGAEGG